MTHNPSDVIAMLESYLKDYGKGYDKQTFLQYIVCSIYTGEEAAIDALKKVVANLESIDPDMNRGIYKKFIVRRADGSSAPGRKHEKCSYFVFDLEHDKFARPALIAYAKACLNEYPDLAIDLARIADTLK